MVSSRHLLGGTLAIIACSLAVTCVRSARAQSAQQAAQQPPKVTLDDRVVADALCPIVYRVDNAATPRGYRYVFYGNGFFVNKNGYLLTAAHVLSRLNCRRPYVLLRSRAMPPRFVEASIIAIDREHDVAVLLATPNPFDTTCNVAFLPLAHEYPQPGHRVVLAALRPFKPRDAYTLEPALEERSAGEVLGFEFSQLEKGRSDTELLLFDHGVQPGQSGAPVISLDSKEVVGLVEGQWLRGDISVVPAAKDRVLQGDAIPSPAASAAAPGVVVPIHYAIALLQQKRVAWHTASANTSGADGNTELPTAFPPTPLSLVPARYPQESLFGGEVLLDALIGRTGTVSDVKVVRGEQPYLEKALAAVRTWTFLPARAAGRAASARMAIVFEFAQAYAPPRDTTVHHYDQDAWAVSRNHTASEGAGEEPATREGVNHDGIALPLTTVEPEYPRASNAEGSVILYESVDAQGDVASVQVVRGVESLTEPAVAASRQWHFAPAMKAGSATESRAVVVITFRRPVVVAARESD